MYTKRPRNIYSLIREIREDRGKTLLEVSFGTGRAEITCKLYESKIADELPPHYILSFCHFFSIPIGAFEKALSNDPELRQAGRLRCGLSGWNDDQPLITPKKADKVKPVGFLTELRLRYGKTIEEVAEATGFSISTAQRYERFGRKAPAHYIVMLGLLYDVNPRSIRDAMHKDKAVRDAGRLGCRLPLK